MTTSILTVPLGERSYDIFFGRDLAPLFHEWICRFFPGGSVFVVTDRNVGRLYGEEIRRWLAGVPCQVLELAPGEESKTWSTVSGIYAFLANGNADRESLIVAFGGGVVGDLAGFAAATWLRGVACVQVPTTLLSQVDSSVGGKTGFNLPEGKNLVGAFHQPRAVFIDHTFLETLDERNLRSGMAEAVKCFLAGNAALWTALEEKGAGWMKMAPDAWQAVISQTVAFKAAIVAKDEKESSTRRILNLGHTIGHGLERAGEFSRLLHGEAVAMGLAWELVFSKRQGMTPPEVEGRVIDLLSAMGYALDDPELPLSSIAAAIGMDKKRIASEIDMPVVTAPGRCTLRRVAVSLVRKELPAIRSELRERLRPQGSAPDIASETLVRIERGEAEDVAASLSRRLSANPRDVESIVLLAEAHRRLGKLATAWDAIKSALEQDPTDQRANRLAREIERELREAPPRDAGGDPNPLEDVLVLGDRVIPLQPAFSFAPSEEHIEAPIAMVGESAPAAERDSSAVAPSDAEERPSGDKEDSARRVEVTTVTMAEVYWRQGDRETAHRIVAEILHADPADERALAWLKEKQDLSAERALLDFLETMAKEYGYDLSRPH